MVMENDVKQGKVNPLVRPKSPQENALYRASLACKIGRDAIEGKNVPDGVSRMEFAMFNLFHAIEDIALAMKSNENGDSCGK